jgi:hypothetical protein
MWAWLYILGHTHFPVESLYHNGPRIYRSLEEKRRAVFVILTFNKYLKKEVSIPTKLPETNNTTFEYNVPKP